ncbi:hypothetical protein LCGC14_2751110 [marine sediment metagenome]|uniref:Uncharacterized protein n=1 Tax=marine sediment metagenome TaxID=412755 RepID=A0A0F9BAC0_9ZZZZ
MIHLGYDVKCQQNVAFYNGQKLYFQYSNRAHKIFKGLYAVSKKVKGALPYTHKVEYSHKAWSDLLSVAQ